MEVEHLFHQMDYKLFFVKFTIYNGSPSFHNISVQTELTMTCEGKHIIEPCKFYLCYEIAFIIFIFYIEQTPKVAKDVKHRTGMQRRTEVT